ncbi:MAG: hypothetical protein COB02_09995 [Candidatus Cloacimonadota bacterium]|nr:MAG: hypothetical protein COB02_09995 [Candidatus Cloacimonadota bacterium]
MKYLFLFIFLISSLFSKNRIYSGDKIIIDGVLYKALDDYYLQTKEGLSLLVLGDLSFFKKNYSKLSSIGEDGLKMSISGSYHSFTDGAGKEIHSIIASDDPKKLIDSAVFDKNDSEEPFYLIEPPAYNWEQTFPKLKNELKNFMVPYLTYARKVEDDYQKNYKDWKKLGNSANDYMGSIYQRSQRWESFFRYSSLFYTFVDALKTYRKKFKKDFKNKVYSSKTYVRVVKKDFLIYLLEKKTDKIIFVYPMSYGGNPDGETKKFDSDYRTPESPDHKRSYETTPLQMKRRLKYSAAPGMTTRLMGIESKLEKDKFWVKFGMNIVIHGSPVSSSIGTKASHGCMRLFDKDALSLFDLTNDTTPVVIE